MPAELKFNEHSEEVQEIIGRVPSWVIRRGITAIAFGVLIVLAGGAFIRLPDTIPSSVWLTRRVTGGDTTYLVKALISRYKSGKVQPGQEVLLKFAEYPFEEYGSLKARVTTIKAQDSVYMADLRLEKGLYTTRRQWLDYRGEMEGVGEIMVDEKSVLQRIFDNIIRRWRTR
ncbi:hypothetical protein [[Flexibacter] sp. ATCC 35208]|uniref:hypothetical protein n=1 Tax=[Flexibacter] sp. ATCC 35208 TaxID=1936242 RepID=UPI0009C433D1|nr:hypothetical protein [[Flexibacter] sp. ATCC 35208]OMP81119.1 hypothetical protein BW716_00595 [[Flexibacter] sp. ATCC 35208]